ncbi:hypothetical protein [Amycolatopsis anabasis]|uniref:hypothetical protein n=1 Tax=Amycolatopsis anabasis TaxID=1840409 RepID=UPI001FE9BA13|nr:hypothetical protein [Amycolatopsis anabasis]
MSEGTEATVMLDHPSWLTADDGAAYRAVRSGRSVWAAITCPPETLDDGELVRVSLVSGTDKAIPEVDVVDPAVLTGIDPVAEALREAGPVARLRNPDLWDALATGIVRQVIRAGHARTLYQRFCRAHGDQITTPAGTAWLFPSPETALALDDAEFTRLGLAFKRPALRAAAHAFLDLGEKWAALEPAHLAREVQAVHRIGPWTAAATVADTTNDFSIHPLFADLAVRTWAPRLAPECSWPEDEKEFATAWRKSAGRQLSERTLLTLAWGVRHANATGAAAM